MPALKEEAPDLLEQGEGESDRRRSIMNSSISIAEVADILPVKDRKTIHINRKEPYSSEELALSQREGLRQLEVRYVLRDRPRAESFATPDGNSYRSAGALVIRKCRDGVKRFVAFFHADAAQHDFMYFDRVINDAKCGRMDGWSRHTFEDGDEGWGFDYTNYQFDHRTVFKPAFVIIEESSETPGIVGFGSAWGYPCREPLCREKFHENEDVRHTLEKLENPLSKYGGYEIEICKDATKPAAEWYVNVWADSDLSELTPAQVATLANDLQWMGIECEKTNNKARILRRNTAVTNELKERDQ